MYRISAKAFRLLNEKVEQFTMEEGDRFQAVEEFPRHTVRVKDIVLCEKTVNARNHVVWGRVKRLRGLDCHSFLTETGRRFDAVNDFEVYWMRRLRNGSGRRT